MTWCSHPTPASHSTGAASSILPAKFQVQPRPCSQPCSQCSTAKQGQPAIVVEISQPKKLCRSQVATDSRRPGAAKVAETAKGPQPTRFSQPSSRCSQPRRDSHGPAANHAQPAMKPVLPVRDSGQRKEHYG